MLFRSMATYNSKNDEYLLHPEADFTISYNETTKTLNFSETYNGLPTRIVIVPKNKNTGQWLTDSYYINVYTDVKLVVTTTSTTSLSTNNDINNPQKDADEGKSISFEPSSVIYK